MKSRLSLIVGTIAIVSGVAGTFALMNQQNNIASANQATIAQAQTGTRLAPQLQNQPVVVKIHADWCRACKQIAPIIKSLEQQYNGRANFVVFDITNQATIKASEAKAKQLGLEGYFAANKTKNATVAIINPANGQVLNQFTKNTNQSDYTNAINSAISQIRGQ
jgi:thiol-disulfide isomerase/thioredoxin